MSSKLPVSQHTYHFPRKWIFFGIFIILVIASNTVRHFWPVESGPREGQQLADVREFEVKEVKVPGHERDMLSIKAAPTGKKLKIAFQDLKPAGKPNAPVLVLVHGSAGGSKRLEPLMKKLAPHFRLIVPDLPGAGGSQRSAADYSVEASAHVVMDLLKQRGVESANFLGFGNGGAVVLNIAHAEPQRVQSLLLLSSVGTQEFELLGNHLVNKIVYGFHLFFVKVFEDIIPHFGLLDKTSINIPYARGFWDSDFTEIKYYIRDYTGPLLVAHGEGDLVISAETAKYTATLAPQAETFYAEGGHWVFLREPEVVSDKLITFVNGAMAGEAATRTITGEPEEPPPPPPAEGSRLWMLMLIIIVCAFVAEDPTCLAAGLLVYQGVLSFTAATVACLISILIGDFTLYMVGYVLGRPALRKAPLKWIIAEYEIDRMAGWFKKKGFQGLLLIMTSRFIPASRLPTFVCAGVMRLSLWRLGILFFIAAAAWTPALIWLAETIGGDVVHKFEHWKHQAMWIAIGLLFSVWFLMHVVVPSLTWRGRRQQVMKLRRWSRHEFWPTSLLYGPLALFILWEGVRRFSLLGLTAANPGLGRQGGFTGEAKSTMYDALKAAAPIAEWCRIPGGKGAVEERFMVARDSMREHGLQYPVVLKPELGDDGMGVNVIRSEAQLREWLERFPEDSILQRWVDGLEYEVVWSRLPGEARGRILAVVEKRPVTVLGDGHRTLEELIWADDRAVSMGSLYLRLNWRRAADVIPAGETVPLSVIGTHRCGIRTVDRQELRTEALAAIFDRIADKVEGGLHYMVYDMRVEKEAMLQDGTKITITGVSGAGSVSSRLHDQYVRLGYSFASSRRQIRRAWVAAEVLRTTGVKTASLWETLATWGEARGRQLIDLRSE
ncbi:MAG: alpha/beta fold hydrolase [Puniceicoccales bacterium]|jgi:pimeloyl-ACP methyl ester carboxylesterase/membrane protein DedA with SNARE-associated domain|nr:alpha/beta fold hydrolase [Puniceicoccales bacterium]